MLVCLAIYYLLPLRKNKNYLTLGLLGPGIKKIKLCCMTGGDVAWKVRRVAAESTSG